MQDSLLVERAFAAQEKLPAPVTAATNSNSSKKGKKASFRSFEDAISGADDFETLLSFMQQQQQGGSVGTTTATTTSVAAAVENPGDEENKFKRLAAAIRSGSARKTKRVREKRGDPNFSESSSSDSEGHPGYVVVPEKKRARGDSTPGVESQLLSVGGMDSPNHTPVSVFDQSPSSTKQHLEDGGNFTPMSDMGILAVMNSPWGEANQEKKKFSRELKVLENKVQKNY